MKSMNAFGWLSSGVLAVMFALVIPMRAAAESPQQQLETTGPQLQTTIEEWHWRDMPH